MRKALSFTFSACLVTGLVSFFWVVGIIGQRPEIPVQTPNVNYVDIILQKKKHNPIDDFCLPACVAPCAQSERLLLPSAY